MELVSDSEAESICESLPDDTDDDPTVDPTVDLSGAESDGSDSSTVYPDLSSFDKSVKRFPDDCQRTDSTKISQSRGLSSSCSDNGRDTNFDVTTYRKIYGEVSYDIKHPGIYIKKVVKGDNTKSVCDQLHACKYCKKVLTNISKHYRLVHYKETEVSSIIALAKDNNDGIARRWNMLRAAGDHMHNSKVIEEQKGLLILGRRQDGTFNSSDYGPCPNCLLWLKLDRSMFSHQEVCSGINHEKNSLQTRGEMRIMSQVISKRLACNPSPKLIEEVYTIMTQDEVTQIAQQDNAIVALGNNWLRRSVGNVSKRKYYTSSKMRQAARLLIQLRLQTNMVDADMSSFLQPKHFDDLVKAALVCSSPSLEDLDDLKSPSTAIKMGYDIKRMVNAIYGAALRVGDDNVSTECKALLQIMKMEWADNVSRLAHTILVTRQFNECKQIPIPDDVAKLQAHVKEEIAKLDLDDISIDTYDAAIRLSQTRLLVLNKRRSGEIDGMLLKNYVNRCKVTESEEALRSYITPNERRMLDDHIVIEVRGKNHRGVPIIVPKDTQPLLAYIADVKVRDDIGINSSNPYMFANRKVGYRRSYDSMKDYSVSAGLKAQDRITSVSLRKFSATLAQIYDLSANDQMNLANHLGHSMDVHKISYRQTSRVIECIDIAKMMLLEEHGMTGKYAGKKLSEIQLEEIYGTLLPEITTDQDKSGHSGVGEIRLEEKLNYTEEDYLIDQDIEQPCSEESETEEMYQLPKKRGPVKTKRQKWTAAEVKELEELFSENLATHACPGQKMVEKAIRTSKANGGCIHNRNWETIKKKVWNMTNKRK